MALFKFQSCNNRVYIDQFFSFHINLFVTILHSNSPLNMLKLRMRLWWILTANTILLTYNFRHGIGLGSRSVFFFNKSFPHGSLATAVLCFETGLYTFCNIGYSNSQFSDCSWYIIHQFRLSLSIVWHIFDVSPVQFFKRWLYSRLQVFVAKITFLLFILNIVISGVYRTRTSLSNSISISQTTDN